MRRLLDSDSMAASPAGKLESERNNGNIYSLMQGLWMKS